MSTFLQTCGSIGVHATLCRESDWGWVVACGFQTLSNVALRKNGKSYQKHIIRSLACSSSPFDESQIELSNFDLNNQFFSSGLILM